MTRYLLDTNVVSCARRLKRQERSFQDFLHSLDVSRSYLSAVTVAEIRFGIQRTRRKDPAFAAVLDEWFWQGVMERYAGRIMPFDEKCATICGDLRTPETQPTSDAMIAATALANGLVVLTRNVADFSPLGVRYVDPWAASGDPEATT